MATAMRSREADISAPPRPPSVGRRGRSTRPINLTDLPERDPDRLGVFERRENDGCAPCLRSRSR